MNTKIPKCIYTYWEGEKNVLVEQCFKQMKKHHSEKDGWTVKIYNNKDINNIFNSILINKLEKVQYKADLLRLYLIKENGGIWLDATCWCDGPVTEWIDIYNSELQGFYRHNDKNLLNTWAFGCSKKNQLIIEWYNEFITAIMIGFNTYKKNSPKYLKKHDIYRLMPYLTLNGCYIVAQKKINKKIELKSSYNGPIKNIYDLIKKRDIREIVNICISDNKKKNPYSLIKINNEARSILSNPLIWNSCPNLNKEKKNLGIYDMYILLISIIIVIFIIIFIFYK